MYCDTADVRVRLPDVTSEYVSDATIADIIAKQSGKIDDLLRKSYDVPFDPVPSTIADLAIDKSLYKVMQTFPDANFDEDLERLGDDIRETEDDLLAGRLTLDGSTTDEAATGNVSAPYFKMISVIPDE